MKVMQVNVVYPVGSTGKIVNDIHKQLLEDGHESIVCYGRGAKIPEANIYKIAPEFVVKMQSLQAKLTGFAYGGAAYSTRKLIRIIEREKPDIVHLHCINGYMVNIYKLLLYLKSNDISTVITLHAEFMYTAGCGHAFDCEKWKTTCGNCPQKGMGRPASKLFDRSHQEWQLMQEAFFQFKRLILVAVSPWLYTRAVQSPFFKDKEIKIILNGIDMENVFKPVDEGEILRKSLNLMGKKVVLHVTPNFNDPVKGGSFLLELANQLKERNISIVIVGPVGKYKFPANIIAVSGIQDQKKLAAYYSMADLTILTSKKETFSMVLCRIAGLWNPGSRF